MTNDETTINGDLKLILHRLDGVGKSIDSLETKQDKYHQTSQGQLVVLEKNQALLQQSHDTLCGQVKTNAGKIEKNDFWTKIIGAITGILILAGTLVALASELMKAR